MSVKLRIFSNPSVLTFVLGAEKNHLSEMVLRTHNLSDSYTMGCRPVRGNNSQALASGLSHVHVDKHGIPILYHLHQCRSFTLQDISCLSW